MPSTKRTDIFHQNKRLIQAGSIRISEHGYDELAADNIFIRDVIDNIATGVVVEEYPDYPKGQCMLVLQKNRNGKPIHVVWGDILNQQWLSPPTGQAQIDGRKVL